MPDKTASPDPRIDAFDPHAVAIAKRQYFQPGDANLADMFHRVAEWVASPEGEDQKRWADVFYDLMVDKRFCPGGRVLAGAATNHGNVLNCFVQDGSPSEEGTNAWVLHLATKLALVTKVGGGNGVNLDPLRPKRPWNGTPGRVYVTIDASHADHDKVRTGTFLDLVHGSYTTKGYRTATFVERDALPTGAEIRSVGDSVDDIWAAAGEAAMAVLEGRELAVDLTELRAEGTPVQGSGGTSSGPSSFAVEVFDNFATWGGLGGAQYAGPVATLRYIFSPTLRAIRQGGCLHPDTLVNTSRGTLRLSELVDAHQMGWQDHHLKVATDDGWKDSPRGYNNGNAPTLRVTLDNGQTLRGTPRHRLKVMRQDGIREWVRLEDLQPGDHVMQVLDQHTGAPVLLRPVDVPHDDATPITTPETLNEHLALFLGYLWGHGFIYAQRVSLAVAHDSPMIDEAPRLFRDLFGLHVTAQPSENEASVTIVAKSAHLVAWLRANGLEKDEARSLNLPKAIRMAPRPVVAAFLRGLFEADGFLSHGMPTLSTASAALAEDVAVMLAGLGVPTERRVVSADIDRYSHHAIHHVRVVRRSGLERFIDRIGAMQGSRLEDVGHHVPDDDAETSWLLPHARAVRAGTLDTLPVGAEGRPCEPSRDPENLSHPIHGERNPTATARERRHASSQVLSDARSELADDAYYVPVRTIEDAGRSLTLDLSVDENKTYLAGGFVTHNTRRGAGMATISITHPDVRDFITAKDIEREQTEGDISTFNISVLVTDEFMKSTKTEGRGTLQEIAEHAWATGEPGLIYIDRINAENPMRAAYGDIKSTNPCFTADTRIATQRGLVTLAELHETQEEPFVLTDRRTYGEELGVLPRTAARVFMTDPAADVYRLETRHGYTVRATANHQFLTPGGWRELRHLQPGDTLLLQSSEGRWSDQYAFSPAVRAAHQELVSTVAGNDREGRTGSTGRRDVQATLHDHPDHWSASFGQLLGLLTGDGFMGDDNAGITMAKTDLPELQSLLDTFQSWFGGTVHEVEGATQWRFGRAGIRFLGELGVDHATVSAKRVPSAIFTAPREAVVAYLQGLFTTVGTVHHDEAERSCSIRLASASQELLRDVQLLLGNFGIVATLRAHHAAGAAATPAERRDHRIDAMAAPYELILDEANRDAFTQKIGFLTRAKQDEVEACIHAQVRRSNVETFETTVADVTFDGIEAVYDTTEPITHSLLANGIVAHQCGEIPLYPGEPCDLGAMNLAAYVEDVNVGLDGFDYERFKDDVATTIRFLDNVLDVNKFALEDNRVMSHKLRRLGLGVMGLADALIKMGFAYDSDEGRAAVHAMIGALHDSAVEASEKLAEERGTFPGLVDAEGIRDRRNVAVLTVAPTGTTSMLMGVSSGVEPVFAPFIYRKIGDSYAALIHPLFQDLLNEHAPHPDFEKDGKWDWDKVVEKVQDNHGSVQGLDFVPDAVKAVLICAHDIAPNDHVKMQGVVQRAFDAGAKAANSISKTINLPNAASVDDVFEAYALAFDEGCKGITVYRDGSRQFQVLSTKVEKKDEESTDSGGSGVAASSQPASVSTAVAVATDTAHAPTPPRTAPAAPANANALAARANLLPGEPLFDRPARLEGFTDAVKLMLPNGESRGFYVIVNKQDGLPSEVFILSGKAGDEANADSEALGRVVSIALQYGVPAEAIVKTLRGINGGMYGSYQGRMVASKADLIAVALESAGTENVLNKGRGCPDCGAPLRFEEGCMKCESCGYSKCG